MDQGAKILIVEKTKDEFAELCPVDFLDGIDRMYNSLVDSAKMLEERLKSRGYSAEVRYGLYDIEPEDFSSAKWALIHPAPSQINDIKHIREEYPEVRIVIITGENRGSDAVDAMQDIDGTFILMKPYRTSELERILDSR